MIFNIISLLMITCIITCTLQHSPSNEPYLLSNEVSETDYKKIKFYLYTRNNPGANQELKINDTSRLVKSFFNPNQAVKIIIHGWISNNETIIAINSIKNAYVNTTEFNVIVVDWRELANKSYKAAKTYADAVVWMVTEMIKFLIANGVSTAKMHLIGHSIGAHIAGNVGKNLKEINKVVNAITGLDPALPLYKFCPEKQRLDSTDAWHVEVIHSSTNSWGYRAPLGHVDYYPNGGRIQPGCNDERGLCAHHRSILYYSDSITDTRAAYTSIYWESTDRIVYNSTRRVNMSGLRLNYAARGQYYMLTRSFQPYALGDPTNWSSNIKKATNIKDDL